MRREVPLGSLSVGRCFAYEAQPEPAFDEPASTGLSSVRSVMGPDTVWKITESGDGPVRAVNARGQECELPATLMVGEVPRGGYDRLVERVADPDDPLGV